MPSKTSRKRKALSANSKPQKSQLEAGSKLFGDFILEDVNLYRLNRHTRTIYLGGEQTVVDAADPGSIEPGVEHNMADRFEQNLGILSGIDSLKPILVLMSSCGGCWEEGMQIFSAILTCPNPVTVLATKWARSMTSIIPLAADKFAIRPPANYMFHHGNYFFDGLVQQATTDFEELLRSREMMLRIYVARLKQRGKFKNWEENQIRQMLEEKMEKKIDVWLDAYEARRWGFVDSVFEGNWSTLLVTKKNESHRKAMMRAINRPINIEYKVS